MMKLNSNGLLRSQVYDHIRKLIQEGFFKPGSAVDIKQMSSELGVSRTPLREALLQLQFEGFLRLLPQRGIRINELSLEELHEIYEILGGLESRVLISVANRIGSVEIKKMRVINAQMADSFNNPDVTSFYDYNLKFHSVFLDLSTNKQLLRYAYSLKQRLYNFTKIDYGPNWKNQNIQEHLKFLDILEFGDAREAADFLRDVHWVFQYSDDFLAATQNPA